MDMLSEQQVLCAVCAADGAPAPRRQVGVRANSSSSMHAAASHGPMGLGGSRSAAHTKDNQAPAHVAVAHAANRPLSSMAQQRVFLHNGSSSRVPQPASKRRARGTHNSVSMTTTGCAVIFILNHWGNAPCHSQQPASTCSYGCPHRMLLTLSHPAAAAALPWHPDPPALFSSPQPM